MRMKKLLIIAAAALLAAACAKTYEVKETTPPAIGFGTWTETLTKARAAGASAFGNGDSFVVEGIKNPGASQTVVFNNTEVSTTDGTSWTYTNTRYWDLDATGYVFYAVSSPNTSLTLVADANTTANNGTIAATSVTFSGENNDILIADAVPVAPAAYGTPVALSFKHVGALVDLKVKKTANLDGSTVAITAMQLEGIDGTATFSVTGYSDNVPTVAWGAGDGNTTYTRTSGVTDVTLPTGVSSSAADDLINTLVVMPQTLTDTKILKLSYTITDAAGNVNTFTDKSIKLNLFDNTDYPTDDDGNTDGNQYNGGTKVTSWAAATHYIYTLTIDAQAISFTASITDWATPATNAYYYLVQ